MTLHKWPVRLAFALLGLWGLAYWSLTLLAVHHNYVALPIWDYWITVMHLDQYEKVDFSILWLQHNDHRLIVPEIVFAADYLFFRGRQILPMAVNIVCHMVTAFLFLWTLYRTPGVPRRSAIGGMLLCGILMGWRGLAFLLSASLSLQWTLFEFFAAIAFWQTARARNPDFRWVRLAIAICCAIGAEFSSAQGMAVWPILVAAALWMRFRRREIAALAVSGAVFIGLFFVGYTKASESQDVIHHLGFRLQFVACFLGLPFSLINSRFGIVMGGLSLVLFASLLWRLRRDDVRGESSGVLYMGLASLALATAILISLGRMDLEDLGFEKAKAGRYLLMPILYWSSLLMTTVWLVSRQRHGSFRVALILSGAAILMACTLPLAGFNEANDYARFQEASLSIEAGLEDKGMIEEVVYPDVTVTRWLLPLLRERRMSIYTDSRYSWIGKAFPTGSVKKENREMEGNIQIKNPVPGGLEVVGWITRDFDGKDLVFLDPSDRVIGLGEIPSSGLPRALATSVPAHRAGWVGFINQKYPSSVARAWVFSPDRSRLYPVGPEIPLHCLIRVDPR